MFQLKFETVNDAFLGDPANEIVNILEKVMRSAAREIPDAPGGIEVGGSILDYNGNKVGEWSYDPPQYAHEVVLKVTLRMEEMDSPSSEASAEIALRLVDEVITEAVAGDAQVEVISHGDLEEDE